MPPAPAGSRWAARWPKPWSPSIQSSRSLARRPPPGAGQAHRSAGRDLPGQETSRDRTTLATNILTDYASDDPNLVAELLMDADPRRMRSSSPSPSGRRRRPCPCSRRRSPRKPRSRGMILPSIPPGPSRTPLSPSKIESAQGMLTERFAFCQTMPLDEFLKVAEALRPSGYRPTRFRPYAEGKTLRVAAVWTRDGRPWRLAHDQSADEIRQTDERNRKEGYLPVDVAGYLAAGGDEGKPTSRFAALWAQRTGPDDDARMVVASSVAELTKVQAQLKNAGLVPLTLHAWRQADDKLSYSGVWHKTATGTSDTASFQNGLSEADLPGVVAQQSGSLIDLDLAAAPPPPSTKERAASALQAAEAALKAKPDDLNARFARATAYFQLGEYQKAIDDLNAVIEKAPQFVVGLPVPSHRPRPARSQGPGQGGSGAVPEGQLHRESRSSTWPSSWRRNWAREPTRRSRRWKQHSRNSPRIPACTTMPPVPTPWHLRLLPGRTRRRSKSLRSEPSACSARRSRTATPTTTTCRRTPTSTRSVTSRRSPRS